MLMMEKKVETTILCRDVNKDQVAIPKLELHRILTLRVQGPK